MRLANINGRAADRLRPNGRSVDVEAATDGDVSSDPMEALAALDRLASIEVPADAPMVAAEDLGAPVPRPQKILGAGINYFLHAKEAGFDLPDQPLFFSKLPSALCGPNDPIVIPDGRGQVDWEAELVVVIGRTASRVDEADAWSYVAGLTAGQDISDREEQFRSLRQFTMGKSFDTFAPLGPVLVTPDEFANRDDVGIRCWIDGELVQDGRTSDCIFSIAQLIAWVSQSARSSPATSSSRARRPASATSARRRASSAAGETLETEIEGIGVSATVACPARRTSVGPTRTSRR